MRGLSTTLAVCVLIALTGQAGAAEKAKPKGGIDFSKPLGPASDYPDLPGVKKYDPLKADDNDGFTCTTVLRSQRDDDSPFGRTLSRRVYRCEKNGFVIEREDPPLRGQWLPGINPPDH
jgi:hypothetical protein